MFLDVRVRNRILRISIKYSIQINTPAFVILGDQLAFVVLCARLAFVVLSVWVAFAVVTFAVVAFAVVSFAANVHWCPVTTQNRQRILDI